MKHAFQAGVSQNSGDVMLRIGGNLVWCSGGVIMLYNVYLSYFIMYILLCIFHNVYLIFYFILQANKKCLLLLILNRILRSVEYPIICKEIVRKS